MGKKEKKDSKKVNLTPEQNAMLQAANSGIFPSNIKDALISSVIHQYHKDHGKYIDITSKEIIADTVGDDNVFTKKQPKRVFFANGYKRAETYNQDGSVKDVFYVKAKTDAKDIENIVVQSLQIMAQCNAKEFGAEMTQLLVDQIGLQEA